MFFDKRQHCGNCNGKNNWPLGNVQAFRRCTIWHQFQIPISVGYGCTTQSLLVIVAPLWSDLDYAQKLGMLEFEFTNSLRDHEHHFHLKEMCGKHYRKSHTFAKRNAQCKMIDTLPPFPCRPPVYAIHGVCLQKPRPVSVPVPGVWRNQTLWGRLRRRPCVRWLW